MKLATIALSTGISAGLVLALSASSAGAFSLRTPQIAFASAALQSHLNTVDGGINALTDQIDGQAFATGFTGNAAFTITLRNATGATIGVYNTTDASLPNPSATFQLFPASAGPGYSVACRFDVSGGLGVKLYDATSTLVSTTNYTGVNRAHFGFYISGPNGTWYSQDGRNGGNAQILSYMGTGANYGNWIECFEESAYNASTSTFTGAVLMMQSVNTTAAAGSTWGSLKKSYR